MFFKDFKDVTTKKVQEKYKSGTRFKKYKFGVFLDDFLRLKMKKYKKSTSGTRLVQEKTGN